MIAIPLRAQDGTIRAHALVDDQDAMWANFRWHLHDAGYARRDVMIEGKRRKQYLHRMVLGLEEGDPTEIDHFNGDRLDCRRSNLRLATHAQNAQNKGKYKKSGTSRHRGVHWDKNRGKWMVIVKHKGKKHHLGRYEDEDVAGSVASTMRLLLFSHTNENRRSMP